MLNDETLQKLEALIVLVNDPIPSFAATHPAGPFPASPPFCR